MGLGRGGGLQAGILGLGRLGGVGVGGRRGCLGG